MLQVIDGPLFMPRRPNARIGHEKNTMTSEPGGLNADLRQNSGCEEHLAPGNVLELQNSVGNFKAEP